MSGGLPQLDSGRSLRVLIVDDNRVRSDAIGRALEAGGYDFTTASPPAAWEVTSILEAEVILLTVPGDEQKTTENVFDLRRQLAPQDLIMIALTEDHDRAARIRNTGSGFDYAIPWDSPAQEFHRVLYWANHLRWQDSLRAEPKQVMQLSLARVS